MFVDMLNDSFVHEQDMRSAADVWMYSHWKDELVILSVEVIEVVHPDGLYVSRIHLGSGCQHSVSSSTRLPYPAMTVGGLLYEHPRASLAEYRHSPAGCLTLAAGHRCTRIQVSQRALWPGPSQVVSSNLLPA